MQCFSVLYYAVSKRVYCVPLLAEGHRVPTQTDRLTSGPDLMCVGARICRSVPLSVCHTTFAVVWALEIYYRSLSLSLSSLSPLSPSPSLSLPLSLSPSLSLLSLSPVSLSLPLSLPFSLSPPPLSLSHPFSLSLSLIMLITNTLTKQQLSGKEPMKGKQSNSALSGRQVLSCFCGRWRAVHCPVVNTSSPAARGDKPSTQQKRETLESCGDAFCNMEMFSATSSRHLLRQSRRDRGESF